MIELIQLINIKCTTLLIPLPVFSGQIDYSHEGTLKCINMLKNFTAGVAILILFLVTIQFIANREVDKDNLKYGIIAILIIIATLFILK